MMPTYEMLINQAKEAQLGDLLANIPFIADLVEVFKTECLGNYSMIVIGKDVSATITSIGEGLSPIWDLLVT
jgi:hypothetical protein